jgi:iron complex outermembrane receptor protein
VLDFEFGYETFPSFAAFTREATTEERVNQEIRLVSTGSSSVSWIAGLFFNELDIDALSEEFTPGIPEWFGIAPPPLPTGDLEYQQLTRETQSEQALFGELSFALTDRLDFTIGGRYFEFDTEQFIAFEIPLVPITNAQTNRADDDGFLGKLNAAYSFSDDVMGYVTLSEGYRIGGANSIAECIQPLQPGQNVCALPNEVLIEPDRTTNFEVGVHSTLADGHVLLNAALYSIDWDDVQTQSVTQNGALPITINGGTAQSRGLELSFEARGDGPWSIRGNYAYNEAELTTNAPGLVDGEDAFAGDRLSGTPEHQASIYLGYGRMLNNGWDMQAAWGVSATSDVLTKVGLRANGETLGGYSLHNASVQVSKDQWSATLYGDNLTNKFAETSVRQDQSLIRNVGGFDLRRYFRNVLRPRSVGIEVRYSFGD